MGVLAHPGESVMQAEAGATHLLGDSYKVRGTFKEISNTEHRPKNNEVSYPQAAPKGDRVRYFPRPGFADQVFWSMMISPREITVSAFP